VRQKIFIIGVLTALAAMPEPANAQRDLPGAVMSVVTAPFRIFGRPRVRPPDVIRPPTNITPPLFRSARPSLTKKSRQARTTILRRRQAAIVRAAGRNRDTRVIPAAAPAAAAGAAAGAAGAAGAAAVPGVAARPPAPDDLVPAVGSPDQGRADPRTPPGAGAARPPGVASWVGPLYWPYAADDLLDYAFLPSGSSDRFWAHGAGDLFQALFAPTSGRAGIEMCGSRQGGTGTWIGPVEQAIKPTEPQRVAFEDVRRALVNANNGIKSACPAAETVASPVQRLNAMSDRLWAMRQAVVLVRIPFEGLYNSLSGNQKARLTDESARTEGRGDDPTAQPSGAARLCLATMAGAEWPSDHIEQRVRPSDEQRRALETLRMTATGMAQLLMASCPQDATTTPLARLQAAEKRLNAMLYAVRIVGPAFHGFYSSLSDEQKTAFVEPTPPRSPQRGRDATGAVRPGRER
jgi:LTXXQ motif family protein